MPRIVLSKTRRLVVAALAVAALAACGSSGNEPAKANGDTIKIAVAASATVFAPVYIAQQRGYFKAAGVNVTLNSGAGAGAVPMLAGGQVDLVYGGVSAALALGQIKPTSVVLSTIGGFGTATIVAGKGITDVSQLAGKRIGTPGTGTTSDSYARLYDKRLGLHADIVPFTTPAALIGAVKTGRVDAGVGTASLYADPIADGSVHVVLKVGDPRATQVLGTKVYPEGVMFGLTDVVKAQHAQMVKVVSAILRANADLQAEDPAKGAQTLKQDSAFASSSESVLTSNLKNDLQFLIPADGEITGEVWNYALGRYRDWDVIRGSSTPAGITYARLIDMSVLDEAKAGQ